MHTTAVPRPGGVHRLGDHEVARIGYGAMQLTPHGAPPISDELGTELLRRAAALGVDHIDTAQFYGTGRANELIRAALHPYPAGLVLVTKVGARAEGGGLVAAQRPEELRAQVEENLRTLAIDQIAVVNLRRLDAPPGILAEGDQRVDLDAQLDVLAALRDEGLIGAIGLSNVSAEQIERARPAGIACVQNASNLLDRAGDPARELCRAYDIPWVPYCPLGSAFAGWPKVTDDPVIRAVADEIGATAAQVGLAWLLSQAPNVLLIPGTRSPDHLAENVAAGDLELTDEQSGRLQAADGPPSD
jgi:pyridoxine 4-dehydrogenase